MIVTLAVLAGLLYGLIKDKPADVMFVGAVVLLAAFGVIAPEDAFSGLRQLGDADRGCLVRGGRGSARDRRHGIRRRTLSGPCRDRGEGLVLHGGRADPVGHGTEQYAQGRTAGSRIDRVVSQAPYFPVAASDAAFIPVDPGGNLLTDRHQHQSGRPGHADQEQFETDGVFSRLAGWACPCAVLGAVYLLTIGRKLLPDRKDLIEQLDETRREYLVEMLVQPGCRLVGKRISEAGLRHLPGLFLIEIDREGQVIGPVAPEEVIQANDRMVFTGVVSTIVDLEKIPGLVPAADTRYEVSPTKQWARQLCETVISPSSPLVGQVVRDADFRGLYDAAIVAVHRNGARLTNKVGDIELHVGDTLLMQVGPNFSRSYRNNPDFYLVSDVEDSRPIRFDRAWIAAMIFVAMITAFVSGIINIMLAAFLAAGAMVATRCISAADARKSVDLPVLIAIAASFGVGKALEQSGVAKLFAETARGGNPLVGPNSYDWLQSTSAPWS